MSDDDRDARREGWNASAEGWDAWFDTIERAARPVSEWLVEAAAVRPGHRVLDVATGTGEPAATAARRVAPGGEVVATDLSETMIAGARHRAGRLGLDNVTFRVVAAEDLDDPPQSFDAVLCRWGLMFIPQVEAALARMRGLLRDGGRLAVAAWAAPSEVPVLGIEREVLEPWFEPGHFAHGPDRLNAFRFCGPGQLESLLAAAGLRSVRCERITVMYEFPDAATYARFRREVSATGAALAKRYPGEVVEEAWQAVADAAAAAHADAGGRVRMENAALGVVGTR